VLSLRKEKPKALVRAVGFESLVVQPAVESLLMQSFFLLVLIDQARLEAVKRTFGRLELGHPDGQVSLGKDSFLSGKYKLELLSHVLEVVSMRISDGLNFIREHD
jgi:hypothetical protein